MLRQKLGRITDHLFARVEYIRRAGGFGRAFPFIDVKVAGQTIVLMFGRGRASRKMTEGVFHWRRLRHLNRSGWLSPLQPWGSF